ncbi:MAG: DUF302 domain-containing protein [Gammaproteobacteria bacterium]|nr:DUF302 domain-containing protein [Gammaproteobacteria bacterium]MCP5136016.1 DUF302 domain-containing protein [Gammaproteobacteria bacterium]
MRRLAAIFCVFFVLPALADDLVSKPSAHDVTTTIDRLVEIVQGKGMTVFARIDHAAGAAAIEQQLAPTQVLIFGSPKAGTPVMQKDARAGLDLPLRVLVYEDADGRTWVSYHDPRALRESYALGELPVPEKMAAMIGALTDQAVAP